MAKRILKILLIAVLIVFLKASPVLAANDQVIVVTGEADSRVTPDIAFITLGSETEAKTAREAQRNSGRAIKKIIDKLVSDKIPQKKIKTAGYNLFFDRDRKVFIATSILEFPVENIDRVGDVLDDAVGAGANIVDNVFYSVKNPEPLREKLLARALKKSRSKANNLARSAGFSVVRIKKIDESEVIGPVIAAEGGAETRGAPSPTVPGELKITASVRVTYSIK